MADPATADNVVSIRLAQPIKDDVKAAVDRCTVRILERLHPGTRWAAADEPVVEMQRAA